MSDLDKIIKALEAARSKIGHGFASQVPGMVSRDELADLLDVAISSLRDSKK